MMVKRLHKWLSLVVFIQLFIWLGTGFLLGKVDHNEAAGKRTFASLTEPTFNWNNVSLSSVNSITKKFPLTSQITLFSLLDKPVYRLKMSAGRHPYQVSDYALVDALTGKQIDFSHAAIDRSALDRLKALALASYQGTAASQDPQFVYPPIEDLPRERNPVWRVNVEDGKQTSIYIRANTGVVIAHINDETRWRSLLMMLHFMDYQQVGSFNNIFIKSFALMTLLLSITGVWWLVKLMINKQIRLVWFSSSKKLLVQANTLNNTHHSDSSVAPNKTNDGDIALTGNANSSLLNVLLDNQVAIPSICGGGGVCGTCRFRNADDLSITDADAQHLSDHDIANGYRLACQHRLSEVSKISIDSKRLRTS